MVAREKQLLMQKNLTIIPVNLLTSTSIEVCKMHSIFDHLLSIKIYCIAMKMREFQKQMITARACRVVKQVSETDSDVEMHIDGTKLESVDSGFDSYKLKDVVTKGKTQNLFCNKCKKLDVFNKEAFLV